MRGFVKRVSAMTFFLLMVLFIYTAQSSKAELIVDEPGSQSFELTGRSIPGGEVLINFDEAWYRTKVDSTGNFRQTFPKKIGYDSIEIREVDADGFDSQKVRVSAKRKQSFDVYYLGTREGKRRFYNPEWNQLTALVNGKVYSGWGLLEVDAAIGDDAKVYASNGIEKGETIEFDLNNPPTIPFSMQLASSGESVKVYGRTIPGLSMEIQMKNEEGQWEGEEYFVSDLDGYFDHDLEKSSYVRGDRVDFRVHIKDSGDDLPLSEDLKKQYIMEAPQLTSENPIVLFEDEKVRAGSTIEGRTKPGMSVHAKFDGVTRQSVIADKDGKFSLLIPSNVSNYPFVVLAVIDSKGNMFGNERHELLEGYKSGRQVSMEKVTSETRELTGYAWRYAKVFASYSNKSTNEAYTVSSRADSDGKFIISIPRHTEGSFTIEANDGKYSTLRQKFDVFDLRPLSVPTYRFENGELIVNTRFPKNIALSVEISKIRKDGTFSVTNHQMMRKNKNDDMYEAKIPEWKDSDRFRLKLIDANEVSSPEVAGEYQDIPDPVIDELTDDSSKITGHTIPGMTVSGYGGYPEIPSVKSDSMGRFELDIPQKNLGSRPTHLSIENTLLRTKRSIKLQYRDTTPPTLAIDPVRDEDSTIRGTVTGGDRLELTIYYWQREKVHKVVPQKSTSYFFYNNLESFRDVEKIEFQATDAMGNVRVETIIPIDTDYPRISGLDIPVAGEDSLMGWTDPGATVTVNVNSKEYVSTSERNGFFYVQTDKLSIHDRVMIKVEDRGKNIVSKTLSDDLVGITDTSLSSDRKLLTVKTNLKQQAVGDVKVIIEAEGESIEKNINRSIEFRLSHLLKNHGTVKFYLMRGSGAKMLVMTKKFSDVTPPDPNTGLILRDDLVQGSNLYGKAENGSTVNLIYKGKMVNSSKVVDHDSFMFVSKDTFKSGEKFTLRVIDAAGNKSEKVLVVKHVPKKPQLDVIYDTSRAITGRTEPGLTVEIKVNQKKYLVKADSRGFYRLNGKWLPGYSVVVKAKGKEGFDSPYERRTVKGQIKIAEIKNATSKSRFIEGKTERDSYVQIFKNGKSISKRVLTTKDGKFKLAIPGQKAKTKLVVKIEKFNFKTLEKAITVGK